MNIGRTRCAAGEAGAGGFGGAAPSSEIRSGFRGRRDEHRAYPAG